MASQEDNKKIFDIGENLKEILGLGIVLGTIYLILSLV